MSQLTLYTAVYASFYRSGTPRVAVGNKRCNRPIKRAYANVNWHILFLLHIIIM